MTGIVFRLKGPEMTHAKFGSRTFAAVSCILLALPALLSAAPASAKPIHRAIAKPVSHQPTVPAAPAKPQTTPDPGPTGPSEVMTGEYKFPAAIDPDILPGITTELWARAFWPKDLSKPHPILFFLHGNHSTCGSGENPRVDSDCSYTNEGVCHNGQVVVPNHDGYNYLAKHLASYGYIVVSINANRGITCASGDEADWGLILARGRLVLKHIETWRKWATEGNAPPELGVSPNDFLNAVDLGNVGLLGHSRGGEGMRAAYNLYNDSGSMWKDRIPGLDIKGIFEIGSVDGQSSRTLDADNTAWNQILPMCDGDVEDLQGRLPFERMSLKTSESRPSPKSLYMVWGANHNFFNTEWQESDSQECDGHKAIYGKGPTSEAQQKVAIATATSFFVGHVGNEKQLAFANHFNPSFALPAWETQITRVDRDFMPTFDQVFDARLEDFDQPTGTNSHHVPNDSNGITISHELDLQPSRAKVNWVHGDSNKFLQLNWAEKKAGLPIDAYTSLDFRIARQDEYSGNVTPTDFRVFLVDDAGKVSASVKVGQFASVLGPANITTVYQTVRIPVTSFGLKAGSKVRGVRFVFDQSPKGGIYLARIRFTAPLTIPVGPALMITASQQQFLSTDVLGLLGIEAIPAEDVMHDAGVDSAELIARTQTQKIREYPAEFVGAHLRLQMGSHLLKAEASSVDLEVRAPGNFPVSDELPALVLAGKRFTMGRYAPGGATDRLVFKVPIRDLFALPDTGEMYVQYGTGAHSRRWRMDDFEKSRLVIE